MDEHAQDLLTINTHRGLYRYTRLPFGVSSAPAMFQAVLEDILRGLNRVRFRLDDILLNEKSEWEHLKLLDEVLTRLEQAGVKLKKSKCVFLQPYVECLGHGLDDKGVHPIADKIEAIRNAPRPTDVRQLKSYLGLLNYYGKFMPNFSTLLHPLYALLQQNQPWVWSQACEQAFQQSKEKLTDSLTHYDPSKPIKLVTDVSAYGAGAVISYVLADGSERPSAFASRTLNSSEMNYSQLQKEALVIIFGVKKFHQHLYGCKFTLETDHQPLVTIFGPRTGVPTLAAARLQRWAIILSAYQYEIKYRNTNTDKRSHKPRSHFVDGAGFYVNRMAKCCTR